MSLYSRRLCHQAIIALAALAVAALARADDPVVFAPGTISGNLNVSGPAFMPAEKIVFFTRGTGSEDRIVLSHRQRSGWAAPRVASFSGKWRDLEPAIASDGSYLIFASNRPTVGDLPLDGVWAGKVVHGLGGNLWRVNKTPNGWSKPTRLPDTINHNDSIYAPVVVHNGSLYFLDLSGKHAHLFMAKYEHGHYSAATPVPFTSSQWSDYTAAVASDESFIIFASNRPPTPSHRVDLFMACRKGSGWGVPKVLPDTINRLSPVEPRLSPDAHMLYFSGSSTPDGPELIWAFDITRLVKANC